MRIHVDVKTWKQLFKPFLPSAANHCRWCQCPLCCFSAAVTGRTVSKSTILCSSKDTNPESWFWRRRDKKKTLVSRLMLHLLRRNLMNCFLDARIILRKKQNTPESSFHLLFLIFFFVNFLCIAYTDRLESGLFLKNLKKCFATCLIFSNTRSVLSLPESTSSSCWTQLFCKKCLCIWSGIWENRVNTNLFLVWKDLSSI